MQTVRKVVKREGVVVRDETIPLVQGHTEIVEIEQTLHIVTPDKRERIDVAFEFDPPLIVSNP